MNNNSKVLIGVLREIAREKGITHQQIAESTGMQRPYITAILSGNQRTSLQGFIGIANACGVIFTIQDKDDQADLAAIINKVSANLGYQDPHQN